MRFSSSPTRVWASFLLKMNEKLHMHFIVVILFFSLPTLLLKVMKVFVTGRLWIITWPLQLIYEFYSLLARSMLLTGACRNHLVSSN